MRRLVGLPIGAPTVSIDGLSIQGLPAKLMREDALSISYGAERTFHFILEQGFQKRHAFAAGDRPTDDSSAGDVDDHIEIEIGPSGPVPSAQ